MYALDSWRFLDLDDLVVFGKCSREIAHVKMCKEGSRVVVVVGHLASCYFFRSVAEAPDATERRGAPCYQCDEVCVARECDLGCEVYSELSPSGRDCQREG